ncbi:MAG: DNA-binding protein WhiA [Pseudoclavibacter sp.]|jgi:DNA-binding protein WhiA
MALTEQLKHELMGCAYPRGRARAAELATILRLSGGLHRISTHLVVEIELDSPALVDRVRLALRELYGAPSELVHLGGGTSNVVRVPEGGEVLARQTGLIDMRNRPLRGLVPALVNGSREISQAIWRGALLAKGSLGDPGHACALDVACPNSEISMALVGSARRLGVAMKAKEVRGQFRVTTRDEEEITSLLRAVGAADTLEIWEEQRHRQEVRPSSTRLVNFDDANLRRSAQAAAAAGARVRRALELLGDEVPDHLRYAGELRLSHPGASLDELGRLADPALTKDAVAGRIRRLLAMADKRAEELGVPDTLASVPNDLDADR